MIDVWEDRDSFDRFAAEKIMPLTAEAGLAQPEIQELPVERTVRGAGDGRGGCAALVRLPGMTGERFRTIAKLVLEGAKAPEGGVFHASGPLEDGWFVFDVWESTDARDRFVSERALPALEGARQKPPEVESFDIHNTLVEPSGVTAVPRS